MAEWSSSSYLYGPGFIYMDPDERVSDFTEMESDLAEAVDERLLEEAADIAGSELWKRAVVDVEGKFRKGDRHFQQGSVVKFVDDGKGRNDSGQGRGIGNHGLDGFDGRGEHGNPGDDVRSKEFPIVVPGHELIGNVDSSNSRERFGGMAVLPFCHSGFAKGTVDRRSDHHSVHDTYKFSFSQKVHRFRTGVDR